MRKLFKPLVFVLMTVLVLSSCKKEEETPAPSTPTPTKMELLTAKPWKISGAEVSPPVQGISDFYNNMFDECIKDNTMSLSADNKLAYNEGADKCNGSSQTESGSWTFDEEKKELSIYTPSLGKKDFELLELTGTTLKLRRFMNVQGTNYELIETYTAQ